MDTNRERQTELPEEVPAVGEAAAIGEVLPLAADPSIEMGHLTDLGNGARLAAHVHTVLRWVEGRGWLHYLDGVWRPDPHAPRRYAVETLLKYRRLNPKFYTGWTMASESLARIKAAVDLAKQYLSIDQEALDAYPHPAAIIATHPKLPTMPPRIIRTPAAIPQPGPL